MSIFTSVKKHVDSVLASCKSMVDKVTDTVTKVAVLAFVFGILLLGVSTFFTTMTVEKIEQVGVKGLIEEVWKGKE